MKILKIIREFSGGNEKKEKINGYNILPNTHPHQYHLQKEL